MSIRSQRKSQANGEEEEEGLPEAKLDFFGARHTLALMGFLGLACVYGMRINLSVAIVAMVNGTIDDSNSSVDACPLPDDYDPNSGYEDGEFNWDASTQGLILGAFYYGYALTNILGGRASERWGGRIVCGVGIVLTGMLTVISPLAAKHSAGMFIFVRVLEGMTEGVTFPSLNTLIANWYPLKERSKFASAIFAGMQFGTVATLSTSGYLCGSDFLGGWPSVFYMFGCAGIIWGVFWFWLVTDEPTEHPRISDAELKYILSQNSVTKAHERPPVPWASIFKSKYFWVIVVMHFGNNWGLYTLLTELPTYLDKIQHVNIKSNGVMSSLPYLGAWIFSIVFSLVTGKLILKGTLSIIRLRKLATIISGYGPMLGLIAMCFVNCHSGLAYCALILGGSFIGASYSGYMCSHSDISPKFAGTLMGLTNTIATIPGFVSPSVTGVLTEDNQTLWAWRYVFIIAAIIYGISVTVYITFITSDVQPWNYINLEENKKGKEERVEEKND